MLNIFKKSSSVRYIIVFVLSAIGLMAIVGSGATPRYTSSYNNNKSYNYNEAHDYMITVIDIDEKPVVNAKVNYKAYDIIKHQSYIKTDGVELINSDENINRTTAPKLLDHKLATESNNISPSSNVFKYRVTAVPDSSYTYWVDFNTRFDYEVNADGYYVKSGSLSSDYGSIDKATSYSPEKSRSKSSNPVKAVVKLYKPIDYFAPEFVLLDKDDKLKAKIYRFLDIIKMQGYLSDAYLKYRSINVTEFKGKKYIKFDFDSGITYNSIKLNKYDIAKNLFDDVIRKILNPLNDNISDPKRFYGYDLTVIGSTKSFADKYASTKQIVYRFYIPENAVKSYKDKDISGQQLIDKSVILMDDERIDLKLQ